MRVLLFTIFIASISSSYSQMPEGKDMSAIMSAAQDAVRPEAEAPQGNPQAQQPGGMPQSRGSRSPVDSMVGGNFSCPFKNETATYTSLRNDARSALTQLKTLQDQCRQATGVAAGQQAARTQLDDDITNLTTPISSDCVQAEEVVQGRVQNIQYLTQEFRLPEQSGGSVVRIRNASQVRDLYPEFRDCVRTSYQESAGDMDLDCVDAAARLQVARAQESGRLGDRQICGQISEEAGQAIARAMNTFEALMNNPQCSAGAPVGASLLNLGVGLAMSNPISGTVGLIARFAQNFLGGLFGRRYSGAEQAMRLIEGDETRRSIQCLFMNMHKETLACGAQDASRNREQLDQQLATARGELQQIQGQLQASNPSLRPDEAIANCAPGSQQRTPESVAAATQSISQIFAPVEEALLAETPDINQVVEAFLPVCQSYRPQRSNLSDIPALEPHLQKFDSLCASSGLPSLDQFRAALLNSEGAKTTLQLQFAGRSVTPSMLTRAPASDPRTCVRERGGDLLLQYQDKSAQVRSLERRILSLPSTDDSSRSNSAMAELFQSFKAPLLRDNGTNLRLDQSLDRTWSAIRELCQGGSASGQFRSYINELHATCLLNASAYLYDRDSRIPNFTNRNRNAESWQNACSSHFLNNTDRAPLLNGGAMTINPAPDARSYETWQCQAYTNFERYKLAMPASDDDLFQEFCGGPQRGTASERSSRGRGRRE